MKKLILIILPLFPLFISCQNQLQNVNYNGVSVKIPTNWGNKNTINHYSEDNISEYQISCWSKENSSSLMIQWVDYEIEDVLYIKLMIETQIERFPMFSQLDFDNIIDIDFQDIKAKKCHFKGFFDNEVFEGEYIAFTKNHNSYIIMIAGNKNFYKSNVYSAILNSIKPNFSKNKIDSENQVKIIDTDTNFTRYEFKDYSLSIPKTMELRNENSMMSLGKAIVKDKIINTKKIDIGDFNFVFQPVGSDDVQDLERQKKALALYARILIQYQKGRIGDFFVWDEDITYTQDEFNQLNKSFKDNILSEAVQIKELNSEIIEIDDIEIKKNDNKIVYIKQLYIRKGFNGDVKVIDYYLYNNDEAVKLTISYRLSEKNLWEKDFDKIIDTFSFNSKK